MKHHRIRLGLIAGLVLFVLFWWWSRSATVQPSGAKIASVKASAIQNGDPAPASPTSQTTSGKHPWQGNTYAPLPADREPGYDRSLPQWPEWDRRNEVDPNWEWKMPVVFYGKVLDQTSQPIQGVKVRFQWTDTSAAGTTEKFTETDEAGLFSLQNERGKRLGVFVSKDGYHAVDRGRGSFEYAAFFEPHYHEPDANNPVVFRLIKKLEGEPLVVGRVNNQLQYDQGAYYYDLKHGKISRQTPSAGLKFSIDRSVSAQGEPFDWTWKVEGVNATVQATDDEFPQLAPEKGYASHWQTSQSAMTEKFQQTAKTRLYVQTNDGLYAVVDLELSQPNRRDTGPNMGVKSLLNPTPGSRNLEFDPAKVIKLP